MTPTEVQFFNQLTLAAAALIAVGVLWRAYQKRVESHIADLQKINTEGYADLRTRIMLIEDAMNIKRAPRIEAMLHETDASAALD